MKIAFIAADAYELKPFRALRPDAWCIAGGAGFALARQAAAQAADQGADSLVSMGVCGALDPALAHGAIVVDAAAAAPRTARAYVSGRVHSQDRVAVTREEKQALARAGALAVDMESAAVRAVAGERGLRYYCIKAVSDRADEALPLDFNRYRNPDGRFSRIHIGFAALARPVLFPRLMALQRKAGQAAQSLGDFLANCEF